LISLIYIRNDLSSKRSTLEMIYPRNDPFSTTTYLRNRDVGAPGGGNA